MRHELPRYLEQAKHIVRGGGGGVLDYPPEDATGNKIPLLGLLGDDPGCSRMS